MSLFKHGKHPRPGYYDKDGKFVTVDTPKTGTIVTASGAGSGYSSFGVGNGVGGDPNGGAGNPQMMNFGGSGAHSDRYNPVRDRLDEGTVMEDWIPRDASGLDRMFRLMYHRDTAGIIVDLLAEIIWDEMEIVGIDDPAIKKVYVDCLNELDPQTFGPLLTREFLVIGRNASSLIFDSERGIFRDVVSHDPDFLRISPIPVKGYDPKIDLIPSPALREFVESTDPRDIDARAALPDVFIKAIQSAGGGAGRTSMLMTPNRSQGTVGSAGIPLDPLNTLFLSRSVFPHDRVGTSLFTRLIPFWALEKALINATLTSARRRSRSILHVKMGLDQMWEPSPQEMDDIVGMFLQADDDPVGAVVGTRTGVEVNEVRDGANFYKWSDEWQMLNEGKMRALGVSDALLSGDATYSNQEDARMFFVQRAKVLQNYMITRLFYNKLFPLLARVHGFVRRPKAHIDHNIRVMGDSNSFTQREALRLPDSELILPKIRFKTDLVSQVDTKRLDLFDKLEEKGVPITLRNWANAGGVDLASQVAELDSDAAVRKRVARWKQEYENASNLEEEAAKLEFVRSLQNLSRENLQSVTGSANVGSMGSFIFWNEKAELGNLKAKELLGWVQAIDPGSNKIHMLSEPLALHSELQQNFGDAAEVAHYVLFRTGLTPVKPNLSKRSQETLMDAIKTSLDKYALHGSVYQLGQYAQQELKLIHELDKSAQEQEKVEFEKSLRKYQKDPLSTKSTKLYSGIGK